MTHTDVLRSYDFDGLAVTTVNSLAGIKQLYIQLKSQKQRCLRGEVAQTIILCEAHPIVNNTARSRSAYRHSRASIAKCQAS